MVLTADTTISSLQISGGALVTHDSTCLPGWTPAPGGTSSSFGSKKCYRVFGDASSWGAAQSACASAVSPTQTGLPRSGALRGALVTVQDQDENSWVSRMCRADSLERDCWVGMARSYKYDLEWEGLGQIVGESRYRSWAAREPSDFQGDEVRSEYGSAELFHVTLGEEISDVAKVAERHWAPMICPWLWRWWPPN